MRLRPPRLLLAAAAALLLAALPGRSEDWPQFRRDPARTARSAELFLPPYALAWSRALGESLSSPVVAGGRVYIGAGSLLYCLEASTGATVWSHDFGGLVSAPPAVSRGRVYAASRRGDLICFSARTGKRLWTVSHGGLQYASPLVSEDGKTVIFGPGVPHREIRAYNALTGALRWSFAARQPSYSSAALSGNSVVVGANDGRFYCLNLSTGAEIWQFQIQDGEIDMATPSIEGGTVYLSATGFPNVYALSLADGSALWSVRPGNYGFAFKGSSAAVLSDRIFLARREIVGSKNALYTHLRTNGNEIWSAKDSASAQLPGFVSSPSVAGDRVFVCMDTTLNAYLTTNASAEDRRELGGASLSSPTPADGRIFAITVDGQMFAFQSGNYAPLAPAAGFTPSGGASYLQGTVTLQWTAAEDPNHDAGLLRYRVRFDNDGEVEDDFDGEALSGAGEAYAVLPALQVSASTKMCWRVRAEDPSGACSAWSPLQEFDYAPPVQSGDVSTRPVAFTASSANQSVLLSWSQPPAGPATYLLSVRSPGEDGFDIPVDLAAQTSYLATGLTNGVAYSFALTATDSATAVESPGVFAEATPRPSILVYKNGVPTAFGPDQIAEAFDFAGSGDTIELAEYTYAVSAQLKLEDRVTLKGVSPSRTILNASGMTQSKTVISVRGGKWREQDGARVELKGLTVANGPDYGIDVGTSGIVVRNVVVSRCKGGITAKEPSNAQILNVTIADNAGHGIDSGSEDLAVRNDIFSRNTGVAVKGKAAGHAPVLRTTYCLFHENGTDHDEAASGTGDLSVPDPRFVNRNVGGYRLESASPAVDGGDPADEFSLEPAPNGGRVDMGAYGNTDEAPASPGTRSALVEEKRTDGVDLALTGCFIGGK